MVVAHAPRKFKFVFRRARTVELIWSTSIEPPFKSPCDAQIPRRACLPAVDPSDCLPSDPENHIAVLVLWEPPCSKFSASNQVRARLRKERWWGNSPGYYGILCLYASVVSRDAGFCVSGVSADKWGGSVRCISCEIPRGVNSRRNTVC